MKKKTGKSFFDYSTKVKKRIVLKAARESSRMQRELVERAKSHVPRKGRI